MTAVLRQSLGMKIYVASSWRNHLQAGVVAALREMGHTVYDFRHPPQGAGFGWKQIDKDWQSWTPSRWLEALAHPLAVAGFKSDMDALKWADACVLVMPCGKSAHLEFGYAVGAGKKTVYFQMEKAEPELMAKMADHIVTDFDALLDVFEPEEESEATP